MLLLIEYFLARASREMGREELEGIGPAAVQLLLDYRWPGNVRELQSVVKQVVLNATGPVIVPQFLPEEVRTGRPPPGLPREAPRANWMRMTCEPSSSSGWIRKQLICMRKLWK